LAVGVRIGLLQGLGGLDDFLEDGVGFCQVRLIVELGDEVAAGGGIHFPQRPRHQKHNQRPPEFRFFHARLTF